MQGQGDVAHGLGALQDDIDLAGNPVGRGVGMMIVGLVIELDGDSHDVLSDKSIICLAMSLLFLKCPETNPNRMN